jgi:hypothetical protein
MVEFYRSDLGISERNGARSGSGYQIVMSWINWDTRIEDPEELEAGMRGAGDEDGEGR